LKTLRRCLLAALCAGLPVHAGEFGSLGNLAQDEFRRMSADLGAAASYKGVTPATPLGLTGFDIGVEVSATKVENSQLFALAGAGSQSDLVVPKLHIHKGLMAGLDIGAFVGGIPELGGALFGAELRYAFMDDTLTRPALAVRLSGTATNDLGGVKVRTGAVDLMLSKRFTAITPYVGVGAVRVVSEASGSALSRESFNDTRVFTGVNVNLAVVNVALEAEKQGDNTTLSAKLGWRF
jgi:hypothetical protein